MPLKIYKMDASPGVRAVLMTAELLKLNYVQQDLDLQNGENMSPEYLEKNPLHSVPFLEDGEFMLSDSHAIITYLASKYGAEKRATLYPNDVNVRATIDSRMYFDTSVLFPTSKQLVKAMISDGIPSQQQIKELTDAYEIMEKYLQKTKYVACNHLTLADVSCVASISSADVVVPVDDKYPKLNAWLRSLEKEDWYEKGNLFGLNKMKEFLNSIGIQTV